MILTKEIKMVVNGTMVKRYKAMGYDVKQYDIIELPVEKLTKYSHKKILCACDICGDQKEVKYNNYCKYIEKDPDNQYTCKVCNLEKRKQTCVEKYGVDNVSKNEKIKQKVKNSMIENGTDYGFRSQSYKDTLMKNYGVKNPSQSSIIHRKQHSGYIFKHHISGLYYRGSYEKNFINYCLENNIEIENFNGSIDYIFEGKNRKYFPDFLIKKSNTVIEIKSSYTYDIEKEQNEAKKEATISSGFNFKFIINKNYNDIF
jgi:hypothetical protein